MKSIDNAMLCKAFFWDSMNHLDNKMIWRRIDHLHKIKAIDAINECNGDLACLTHKAVEFHDTDIDVCHLLKWVVRKVSTALSSKDTRNSNPDRIA